MEKGAYIAVSGSMAQERAMEIITNNLANINTAGFKADRVLFESYLKNQMSPQAEAQLAVERTQGRQPAKNSDTAYLVASRTYTDFSSGPMRQTGNPMDIALEGDGFISVLTEEGERLSRGGTLTIGAVGELATVEGQTVMSVDGRPIFVDGRDFSISPDGTVTVDNQPLGRIKIVRFEDNSKLEKTGNGLFISHDGENMAPADTPVRQGFLEGANVNAVAEITRMITAHRTYEAFQKSLQSHDQMTSRLISDVGK